MEAHASVVFKTKKSETPSTKPLGTSFVLLVFLFLALLASGLAFLFLNNKIKNTAQTKAPVDQKEATMPKEFKAESWKARITNVSKEKGWDVVEVLLSSGETKTLLLDQMVLIFETDSLDSGLASNSKRTRGFDLQAEEEILAVFDKENNLKIYVQR